MTPATLRLTGSGVNAVGGRLIEEGRIDFRLVGPNEPFTVHLVDAHEVAVLQHLANPQRAKDGDELVNHRLHALALGHAHGFVLGVINEKTGNYWTMQAEEIDGKWVIPEKLKVI